MKTQLLLIICICLSLGACRKKGCTNPSATNYNEKAKKDNGSCQYASTVQTFSYGSEAIQKMDLYIPAGHDETTPVVIMVHGGGWIVGYNESETVTSFNGRYGWDILTDLLDDGFACAVIKYRTACYRTDHSSAANDTYKSINRMCEDIDLSIEFLKTNSTELLISNNDYHLLGESAGGHIVQYYGLSQNCDPAVKSVVSMFGPTTLDDHEWKSYLHEIDSVLPNGILVDGINYFRTENNGCDLMTNDYLKLSDELISLGDADTMILNGSNQYLIDLSTSNPVNMQHNVPIFVVHGDDDDLVPFSQAEIMYDALVAKYGDGGCSESDFSCHFKKKIYTNCGHGWTGPICQKNTVMNDILKWFKGH